MVWLEFFACDERKRDHLLQGTFITHSPSFHMFMRTASRDDIQPAAIKLWVVRLFLIPGCFTLAPNSTEECHKWLVCSGGSPCHPPAFLLCKTCSQGSLLLVQVTNET